MHRSERAESLPAPASEKRLDGLSGLGRRRPVGLMAVLLIALGISASGWAEVPSGAQSDASITVQADRLTTVTREHFAEFSGNVKAVRGTTVIQADRLRIYYQAAAMDSLGGGGNDPAADPIANAVQRITASGNVRIRFDDRHAEADQAEYLTQSGNIVLTGRRARIRSGPNLITGAKITLHGQTGEITVERSSEQPVEAVFYTTDALPAAE